MKKIILLVMMFFFVVGCGQKKNMMNDIIANMHEDALLIDVRTKEEFILGHIPNAINIPLDTIKEDIAEKDAEIYLYCRSGNRSATAKKQLEEYGFTNVTDIGGIHQYVGELEKGE